MASNTMIGDVFILVLDCLRRDYVEPYTDEFSTPSLSQLAEDSFVLEKAYSTSSWTIPSHGSLFTGKYPTQHGATAATKRLPQAPKTMAEVAENCGYEPISVSTNPWVSPDFDFYRGFGEHSKFLYPTLPFPDTGSPHDVIYVDNNSVRNFLEVLKWSLEESTFKRLTKTVYNHLFFEESMPSSGIVTEKLISSINEASNQRPIFGFANYMDAHEPYFDDDRTSQISWNLRSVGNPPKIEPSEIRREYASAVSTLDDGIGDFIDALQRQGRYDDALIVCIADHGQCLGEHGYWGHGTYLYDELLHIPAYIKPPGGRQSTTSVQRLFSIREIFDLVTDAFKKDINIETRIRNTAENVIIAESVGRHTNVKLSQEQVSENGYRKFYGDSWSATKNLSSDKLTVEQGNNSTHKTEIQDQIREIIEEKRLSTTNTDGEEQNMASDIERRLEHLGYK